MSKFLKNQKVSKIYLKGLDVATVLHLKIKMNFSVLCLIKNIFNFEDLLKISEHD